MALKGPRALKREEIPSLGELLDSVFRAQREGSMLNEYPQLVNEENLHNLRVFVDGGRVVSHVGMTRRGASIEGSGLELACIGAVATYPEYRGKGLATRLMQDVISLARADGASAMWISGGRGLYKRLGAKAVGTGKRYRASADVLSVLGETDLVALDASRIADLDGLYSREPVRFIRHREDWERALTNHFVMDRPAEFLGVEEAGAICAYLIIQKPDKEGISRVAEYGGSRDWLARALAAVARRMGAKAVEIHVRPEDKLLDSLVGSTGAKAEESAVPGTCLVLDFARFMESFRGRVGERCGWALARRLRFRERGEECVVARGEEEHVITDRGSAAQFVFGGQDLPDNASPLGRELARAFPAPAPWYGVNYV